MSGGTGSGAPRRGGWVVWLVVAVVIVAIVVVRPDSPRPYDLRSVAPDGYRAMRLLLEESGTDVVAADAGDLDASAVPTTPVAYVPVADTVADATVTRWRSYVESGGRLVLGTPSRPLGVDGDEPFVDDRFVPVEGTFRRGAGFCDLFDDDAELGQIELPVVSGDLDHARDGVTSCYGDRSTAAVVAHPLGAGRLVALATPEVFTNELMGMADVDETEVRSLPDNSVLAMRLLGTLDGGEPAPRVAVVTSGVAALPTGGSSSLIDLMPRSVRLGLLQLVAAFGILTVALGRRHGSVVTEPEPVSISGSAFVGAVGDLLERQGAAASAAERLRAAAHRELARDHHLPPDAELGALVALLARRTGREPAEIASILTRPIDGDNDLVELSRDLDRLRQEASHV